MAAIGASSYDSARTHAQNLVIIVLLALASVQCTASVFFDNESWLNLPKYAAGTERNPYQERVALMPVLRFAEHSSSLQKLAHWLDRRNKRLVPAEPVTPEKFASLFVAILSMLAVVGICSIYGWKQSQRWWWLPPSLALLIVYVSYAARYEHALWFPYDMPHMLFFGGACASILTGQVWLFALFFACDLPVRETSIYLIPLSLAFLPNKLKPRSFVLLAVGLLLAWLAVRLSIVHYFRGNSSEIGSRILTNLHLLTSIGDWPTVASALGFLLIPVWMARRHLEQSARLFLWLTIPCFLASAYYGLVVETRIFLEWTLPFALLASAEIFHYLKETTESTPALNSLGTPVEPVRIAPDTPVPEGVPQPVHSLQERVVST